MNEAPNTNPTSGLGNTFSSQPAPQTNPFTADLNKEFTSDFGTNTGTNAVSQIFKEGGFASNDKTKKIVAVVAAVVVLAVVAYVFLGDDSGYDAAVPEGTEEVAADGEEAAEETAAEEEAADGEEAAEETAEEEAADSEEASAEEEEYAEEATSGTGSSAQGTGEYAGPSAAPVKSSGGSASYGYGYSGASAGSGPITLSEPADGSVISYDETQGSAVFTWTGGGGYISFSRNQSMNPTVLRARAPGNKFEFHHPWTGTWYWKVENASGSTEVRSFQVSEPARRNIVLSEPVAGGAVSGNGGTVAWQGDNNVAFYRVEISASGSWANPEYRFATSGNSVSLSGVPAGQYQMRVGAFSEVSGRWEYTAASTVSVQ